MKFLKTHIEFLIILLTGVVLRFIPLFDYQLTYDELSGLERTQFNSFSEVIEKGVKIDAHPALVQLIIFYLVKCFGYVTWLIKLPFLLFSLGAVIYAYAFGLKNFSKQVGLYAAAFLSFSLVFVFYAPIARMYISGVFFSMALIYYFYEIFFNGSQKWTSYLWVGLFALLSALNHHMGALFAFILFASGFFFVRRQNMKPYLITILAIILAYLPHLTVTIYQLGVGGIGRSQGGWLEAPEWTAVFTFIKVLFGTDSNWIIILLLILLSGIINRKFVIKKKQLFLLIIFLFNYSVIFLYSVFRAPVYQNSVMLFSSVTFVVFACSLMETDKPVISLAILFLLGSSLLYNTYVKKDYFHNAVKTVYESQFERTVHYKKLYGSENVYPLFFDADNIMKKVYFKKYNTSFDCRITTDSMMAYPNKTYTVKNQQGGDSTVSSLRLFAEFVSGLKAEYIVLSSSTPLHNAIVTQYYPYLIENTQTQANHIKVYSKNINDAAKIVQPDEVVVTSGLNYPNGFEYKYADKTITSAGVGITGQNEFPFEARADYGEIIRREGMVMLAKVTVKKEDDLPPQFETCISLNDKKTNEALGYSAKSLADFKPQGTETIIYSDHFFGTGHSRFRDNATISCYLWNRGKETLVVSDFQVQVINYWPGKWHFWD